MHLDNPKQQYTLLSFTLSLVVLGFLIPWSICMSLSYSSFLWYYPIPGILISAWIYKDLIFQNSTLPSKELKHNTSETSWQCIPTDVQRTILNFLSPVGALPCISTSRNNLDDFGNHLIKRLREENLAYQMINSINHHTIAMRKDGKLFSWGSNNRGQLGLGHTNNQHTPKLIDPNHFQGKTIKSIHTGHLHTIVQCADGSLFAWGDNNYGQLALGHTNHQYTPQLINANHFQNKTIQSIHIGNYHTLALCTDNSLFSWGHKGLNIRHTPQQINPNELQRKTIRSIYTFPHITLVLCNDGTIFAYDLYAFMNVQLDLEHTNHQNTPQTLPDPLEQAFTEGHQRLNSNAFFSNKSVNPTTRFLSDFVLSSGNTAS